MNISADIASIYEQLGGSDRLEAVVDHFYRRVLADDSVSPIFANVEMDRLHRHQTQFLTYLLGGPNLYSGRSMRIAHQGLGITEGQFDTVAGHLIDSLVSFNVPAEVTDQVIDRVADLKGEIIER